MPRLCTIKKSKFNIPLAKISLVLWGAIGLTVAPLENVCSQVNPLGPDTSVNVTTPDSVVSPSQPAGNCGQSKRSLKSLGQGTKMAARGGVAAFGISKTGGQAGKHGGAAVAGGATAAAGVNTAYSGACDMIQDCPASPLNCGLDLTLTGAGVSTAATSTMATIQELRKRKRLNDSGDNSDIDAQIEDLMKQLSEMEQNVNQQVCDRFPNLEDCDFTEDVKKHGAEVASAMYGADPEIVKTFSKDNGKTLLDTYESAGSEGVNQLLSSRLNGRSGFNGPHQDAISASRSGSFDSQNTDKLAGASKNEKPSKSLQSQKAQKSRSIPSATGGSFAKDSKKGSGADDFMKNLQGLLTGLEDGEKQNRMPGSVGLKRKTTVATPELQRKEVGLFQLMTQRIQNSPRIRKAFDP